MVTPYLLDVNVLVAMHLPGNLDHATARRWFREKGQHAFATCAMTQSGFLRVAGQLSLKGRKLNLEELRVALGNLSDLPGHSFWPMDLPLLNAIQEFQMRIQGHGQITDAYLLGLAIHHMGRLATFDRGLTDLAGHAHRQDVELIS